MCPNSTVTLNPETPISCAFGGFSKESLECSRVAELACGCETRPCVCEQMQGVVTQVLVFGTRVVTRLLLGKIFCGFSMGSYKHV